MKKSTTNENKIEACFQSLNNIENKIKNEGNNMEKKFTQNPRNNLDSYQKAISNMYDELRDEITKFSLMFSKTLKDQIDKIDNLNKKLNDFGGNFDTFVQNTHQMFSDSIFQPMTEMQIYYQPSPAFYENDSIYNEMKLGSPIVIQTTHTKYTQNQLVRKVKNDDSFDPDFFDVEKSFGPSKEKDIFHGKPVSVKIPEIVKLKKKKK